MVGFGQFFTTARAREKETAQRPPRREAPPEGEVYRERPVTYTCYLREAPRDGSAMR